MLLDGVVGGNMNQKEVSTEQIDIYCNLWRKQLDLDGSQKQMQTCCIY